VRTSADDGNPVHQKPRAWTAERVCQRPQNGSEMNLREELLRVYEDARSNRSSEENETTDRAAAELFDAGTADRAKAVGDVAPVFSLPSATGETVTLSDLLEDGPVVLSFYRGSWCPYCNLELRALQANIMEFKARNARLVAISPQVPDESLSTAEKHSLTLTF